MSTPAQAVVDKVSTVEVVAGIVADVILNRHHIVRTIERQACVVGPAETLKRLIHERRPDGSDNLSFPSEHSAEMALVSVPHGAGWGLSLTFSVQLERVIARKHWTWDTFAGAALGAGCSRIP